LDPFIQMSHWLIWRIDISIQQRKFLSELPRLPLEGSLDLTYRCNNRCRHCWISIPVDAEEQRDELTFSEIKGIVTEARRLGCRSWSISGGEPMLRGDFAEIFELLTAKATAYTLYTNGTFITTAIARMLKKKGHKMVSIYGATSQVHDHITRNTGSFQATMQGIAYLKEAGAGFVVQVVPMRGNYHQLDDMVKLARHLSPQYRFGAAWLHLSACALPQRNAEIARQRLAPHEVIKIDQPDMSYEYERMDERDASCLSAAAENHLLARCIAHRNNFHIDPYGYMTFCYYIKDSTLRYDLRRGSFQEAWDSFIPALADKVLGGPEYLANCGSCELRLDCRWCDVYGYLEHRRHGAKVVYLCEVAQAQKAFKTNWQRHHRRYYQIAGITVQVDADLPITDQTFAPKFRQFQVDTPGSDLIAIRHHFSLPEVEPHNLGREVYRKAPWAIYQKNRSWIYLGIGPEDLEPSLHKVAVFNYDFTRSRIYHPKEEIFTQGNLPSLTLLPTDQILLAQVIAHRQGCFFHSSAAVLEGQGLLFVGHSEAGKSTTVKMLQGEAEILCDDRNIVRRWPEGFRVHGSWSHGEVPLVSSTSAPLRAILLLQKSKRNRLTILEDRRTTLSRLLACLIKPLVTTDWWEKTLNLLGQLTREIPCYLMEFDRSDEIVKGLKQLL
jgi:MoaA/NifB/PqqE/SkfB family radical SAM enzyme